MNDGKDRRGWEDAREQREDAARQQETTQRQHQIEDLFTDVRELPAGEREARIAAANVTDDVRAEVRSLLAYDGETLGNTQAPRGVFDPATCLGLSVGGFNIRAIIGVGGMGTVYEADQDRPQRRVALKVLGAAGTRPSVSRRFLQESDFLARLDHPGIARVIAAGLLRTSDGGERPYFAMELVAGGRPITAWARETRASRDAALRVFADACDAVGAGHRAGIAHLDLKPGNILVGTDGRARIIDYGIARSMEEANKEATSSESRGILGTPQYMSPEQFAGGTHPIDSRADVYALGLILYELATGRLPYETRGLGLKSVARLVTETAPAAPRLVDANIPRALDAVIQHAIAKSPDARYGTASELADDLRRFLADEQVVAAPATRLDGFARLVRKNKALTALAVLAFAASIIAAILGVEQAVESTRAARASAHSTSLANLRAATGALREGDPAEAARLLDRVRVEDRDWESRHLSASVVRYELLAPIFSEILHVAVAGDTGEIVCGVTSGFVVVVDPKRPEPYEIHDLREEFGDVQSKYFPTIAISANGRRILAPLGSGRLMELNRDRGSWSEFPVAGPWCADAEGATVVADMGSIMFVPRDKVQPSARVAFEGTPISVSIARGGRFAAVLLAEGAVAFYEIDRAAGKISERWRRKDVFRQPRALAVADDGSSVIAVSRDPELVRLDGRDGSIARRAALAGGAVFELSFARSGHAVAASSWANTSRIIDTETLAIREYLGGTLSHVWGIDFSPDDSRVIGRVIAPVPDPSEGPSNMEWLGAYRVGVSGAARDIDLGREVLAADRELADGRVWIVDGDGVLGAIRVEDGVFEPIGSIGAEAISAFRLKRVGDSFYVGSRTGSVARFDRGADGALVERWRRQVYGSVVTSLDVSPDGRSIACGARERTAILLETATGEERWRHPLPLGRSGPERLQVSRFGFIDGGRSVVPLAVDAGTYVPVLSIDDGRETRVFLSESVEVEGAVPASEDRFIGVGVTGGVFLLEEGRPFGAANVARNGGVLAMLPGGERCMFAARDGLLRIVSLDLDAGRNGTHELRGVEDLMRLDLPTGAVLCVGFDPARDEVVVVTGRGQLRAWSGRLDP
ncbi:MAG: WD40 repeat domain-containing serine/threonine protein kinase, partial [bacterium]